MATFDFDQPDAAEAALFGPPQPKAGPLMPTPANDHAADDEPPVTDYVSGRVWPGGHMDLASATRDYQRMMEWWQDPAPGTCRKMAWTALWRWVDTTHHLDEVTFACAQDGHRIVSFNGNGWHGSWRMVHGMYLHVTLNCRYPVAEGVKWVTFQNVPGTATWIGIKDSQVLGWNVILTNIGMHPEARDVPGSNLPILP